MQPITNLMRMHVAENSSLHRRLVLLLSVALALFCVPAAAQQTGGGSSSKTPANPFASFLKKKPLLPSLHRNFRPPFQNSRPPFHCLTSPQIAGTGPTLRDAAGKLPTRDQIDAIQTAIAELEPSVATKQQEVNELLAGTPNSLEIREQESYWRGIKTYTAGWQQQLLAWANSAQAAVNMLDAQEPAWAATLARTRTTRNSGRFCR